ncbi:non-specific lipid transfer protein-like 1 isoform X1 [Zea mays]|nr:non-specific lipid transfer protein-like 1 isoform X1 [Zea mays]|eukprot:XP_008670593.1 lipid binding protein isoform X1 [Zea mays]
MPPGQEPLEDLVVRAGRPRDDDSAAFKRAAPRAKRDAYQIPSRASKPTSATQVASSLVLSFSPGPAMARLGLLALAVAVLALASGVASQAPGPAPSADCASALAGLMGCLPYVQQGSTQGKPDRECCAGVKAALKSPATVVCLCAAVGQNYGMPVNLTRGAGLPAACGEDPAALSKCNKPTASGTAPAVPSPGSSKSSSSAAAAIRFPVSAFAVVVAATLLSHCLL